jgi:predicted acylesterase/phospholipase RssA
MPDRAPRRGPARETAATQARADRRTAPRKTDRRKPINLALQGGGSHGAFTWGVLDRLLEDDGLRIVEISGASAGAMNAVVLAQGMADGGEAAARASLARFWRSVAEAGAASPIRRGPLAVLTGDWSLDRSPGYLAADLLSRVASPYDLNPGGFNPLRALLESQIDFDKVRACGSVALHIATTCVETGRPEIFSNERVDADVVLASACLPTLFHAVKIGDRHFWDGGFSGNPPLHPFFGSSPTEDIVIVQINPVVFLELAQQVLLARRQLDRRFDGQLDIHVAHAGAAQRGHALAAQAHLATGLGAFGHLHAGRPPSIVGTSTSPPSAARSSTRAHGSRGPCRRAGTAVVLHSMKM